MYIAFEVTKSLSRYTLAEAVKVPPIGFEPITLKLRVSCSAVELRRPDEAKLYSDSKGEATGERALSAESPASISRSNDFCHLH